MKKCTKCKVNKNITEFHKDKYEPDGFRIFCKSCISLYRKEHQDTIRIYRLQYNKLNKVKIQKSQKAYELKNKDAMFDYRKNWKLKNRYGITTQDYLNMVISQDNKCAICNSPETIRQNNKVNELAIDHDHKTNKVRGLLCGSCNRGIGLFKENTNLLKLAITYLEKYNVHQENHTEPVSET